MATTHTLLAGLLLPGLLLPACAVQQDHKRMARAFLNGRTAAEALAPASMDFRFYLGGPDVPPLTRAAFYDAIQWDTTLRRTADIIRMTSRADTTTALFRETNDLTRLLDHPGWVATITFSFDRSHGGLITEAIFEPDPANEPIAPYLDAALPYLREHHPETLAAIYPERTLIMTAETARAWVRLLTEWRAATDRRSGGYRCNEPNALAQRSSNVDSSAPSAGGFPWARSASFPASAPLASARTPATAGSPSGNVSNLMP